MKVTKIVRLIIFAVIKSSFFVFSFMILAYSTQFVMNRLELVKRIHLKNNYGKIKDKDCNGKNDYGRISGLFKQNPAS